MSVKNIKIIQRGRSMVEMLGVLAIIGVLSIGGIAGYSKAMLQYKTNKTADQIVQIVSGLRTLYSSQDEYDVSCPGAGCAILEKGHIAPDEMWEGDNLVNPFGGAVSVQTGDKKATGDNKAFTVSSAGLPREACMALATYDWGSGSSSGLIAVTIGSGAAPDTFASLKGCNGAAATPIACPNGSNLSVPMPVSTAAGKCGNGSYIMLKFF